MQPILPGLTTPSALRLTGSVPDVRAWQVGQVLHAVALRASANGQVSLQIGQTRIEAQTQTAISAGQRLELEVVKLGEQPVLKMLPAPAAPADPVTSALRTALPKQTGSAPLLANLNLLARTAATPDKAPSLPAPVLQLAERIVRELADSRQASTARGLQQALRDSGTFLEAKLAQLARGGTAELGADLKAALLRLEQMLRETPRTPSPATPPQPPTTASTPARPEQTPQPAPPLRGAVPQPQAPAAPTLARVELAATALEELQRQTEGTLARVQLNQLASTPAQTAPQPSWLLELPIRHDERIDLFHLRIEPDAGNKTEQETQDRQWVVLLAFDLPGLGPVHARVTVQGEQASAVFWAEQPATVQAFQSHLAELDKTLRQAGLGVGQLACHGGPPPHPAPGPRTPVLETRA